MSVKALFNLQGQTALITGGSRGLGLQMAEALGEMGARLAITARKADELEQARAHLQGLGYEVATFTNDLQQFDRIPALVDAVLQQLGTVDILVNNAGASVRRLSDAARPARAGAPGAAAAAGHLPGLSQAAPTPPLFPTYSRRHRP